MRIHTTLQHWLSWFGAVQATVSQRRQLNYLLHYNDKTLHDVGLCRTDIELVMRLPLGKSMFDRLIHLSQQRRDYEARFRGDQCHEN